MIKEFHNFALNEDAAVRLPNDIDYWRERGKRGKDCIIYTHNDMDGIFSAIAIRDYLKNRGFTISGYGVLDYIDGWKVFTIDKTYINICVDYAEDNEALDLYIDHHMEEGDVYKKSEFSIKMTSDSCYGLITRMLGMPTDKYIISVISMIDAAKYDEYNVDIKTILNYNLKDIMKSENPRLIFAGAFNQLMKRSDYKTIIEVIHNGTLSILKIFKLFKIFYPINNLKVKRGVNKEEVRQRILRGDKWGDIEGLVEVPQFVPDSIDRIQKMMLKTGGRYEKPFIHTFEDFMDFFWKDDENKFVFDGFAVIKNLVYVPVGTWANALRARALIATVLGRHDKDIQFILLDYGSSLQVASYRNIDNMGQLPILRGGEILNDLDKYTRVLLYFVLPRFFNFKYTGAKAGGHKGIGNLSNILGRCEVDRYKGIKFTDLMKNVIIRDITGIRNWNLSLVWNANPPEERETPAKIINQRLMMIDQIRKINI